MGSQWDIVTSVGTVVELDVRRGARVVSNGGHGGSPWRGEGVWGHGRARNWRQWGRGGSVSTVVELDVRQGALVVRSRGVGAGGEV